MEEAKQQQIKMPSPVTHQKCRTQASKSLLEARTHFDVQVEHWTKYREPLVKDGFDVDAALKILSENKRTISEVLSERLL